MAVTGGLLVDTSVLTRLGIDPVRVAVQRLGPGVARSGLTDLEIGYSARSAAEWDALHIALESFRSIEIEAHHLRRAAYVQRTLAERGLRGRKVPHLVIAACAEDHGMTMVHYDRDFDHIASVTEQPTMWVVPAGSID